MRKCLVEYIVDPKTNKQLWSCNKGLSRSVHVATATHCWRYNCPGIHVQEIPKLKECSYLKCTNTLTQSAKTKYCNPKCKSKESSRRYRLKLKENR
jgi:hypothetical protein